MPTLGTASADSLVGTGDAELISGLEGNDSLLGLGGDDILAGGPGNDTLDGGDANDMLMDDSGSNTLLGGAGDDTILAAAIAAINGGNGNDSIFASGAGSTVVAGLGDDWIFLEASATVTGGSGIDTVSILGSFSYPTGTQAAPVVVTDFTVGAAGDRLDLVPWLTGLATTGYAAGNPFGSSGFLRARQDGSDTVIDWDSTGGADGFVPLVRLQGITATALTAENLGFASDGTDTTRLFLIGTTAAESLAGGAGDDHLFGGNGNDTLLGGAGDDELFGEDGDDSLDGGSGANALDGGTGNDTYVVRSSADVVTELADQGIDTIRSWINLTLGANVENGVIEPGTGPRQITGNALANAITGNESDNLLVGGPGNDTLTGGDGTDFLYGQGDNDSLAGGAGVDVLLGSTGNDTLDGGSNPGNLGDVLLGGAGNDTYYVDSGYDLVDEGNLSIYASHGFGGSDTIISTANFFWDLYSIGERLVIAPNAHDPSGAGTTIVGSVFRNTMVGNAGTNIMFGRGGADTYQAGDGVDYISLSTLGVTNSGNYVANGVNTVIVDPRQTGRVSYDIIFEFEPGYDKIDLTAYNYTSASQVLARGRNDGLGSCYFSIGDGLDFVYLVGRTTAQITAADFIL